MAVLLVPASLAFFFGLLALADALERRSSVFLVRSSLRSPLSCEETEAVIAANLAPVIEAAGLGREEADVDPGEAAASRVEEALGVVAAAEAVDAPEGVLLDEPVVPRPPLEAPVAVAGDVRPAL